MSRPYSDAQLESFLDECLPTGAMAEVEKDLRSDPSLRERLAVIVGRRDAGLHSLGEVWRRHRVTCLTRDELGSLILGVLSPDHEKYARFHIEKVGCRFCAANMADLRRQQDETEEAVTVRHKKYFESSAGYLDRTRHFRK